MNSFIRNICIPYVLPVIAAALMLVFASGYNTNADADLEGNSNSAFHLCHQQYALCTSARCIPLPGDPTRAICSCVVKEGASVATVPCNMLKPSTDSFGIRTVYSTFSFVQFENGKKALYCPDGTPWTNCLNQQCIVDPTNPRKAICTCDIVRGGGRWFTAGGDCDKSTCATGYWSGAFIQGSNKITRFLVKALSLKKSPLKACPHHNEDSSSSS